jgi:hypothetical protein
MLRGHKLLILIPAILLILAFFGMTPLNMAQRLASRGPSTHCKQTQWSNHCPFNSIASHNDPTIVNLNSTPLDPKSMPAFDIHDLDSDSTHSNMIFNSVPLRC